MDLSMDDLVLVSVDDHMVEPPDMFERHVPAKYRDRAPRIEERNGAQFWVFEGKVSPNIGIAATVGRPREELGLEPNRFEQMREGCYDVDARVRDMNANGTLASLCFPTIPGVHGAMFTNVEDRECGLVMLQAYNDWHIEDWWGAHPTRFIPLALIPYWDAKLAADEVRRMARKGCRVFNFCQNVAAMGFPSFHDSHWDPFYTAVCDVGGALAVHLGTSGKPMFNSLDAPFSGYLAQVNIDMASFASDVIFSPVLQRFPNLKIAMSEGGIGWIPYFLERCKWIHDRHSVWAHHDLGGKTPLEVFRQQILTCYIDDPCGIEMRDKIGIECISWECDSPHSYCTWPESPEFLAKQLAGLRREEIDKITHQNALRFFDSDLLEKVGRENATVKALRAQAVGMDLSAPSPEGMTGPPKGEKRQLQVKDLMYQIQSTL
ncbi:MAG: amidohydrolase family protein [Gemmatimonadota bacterium]